jgi:transcriptional regulator with XRE-family HTH domain
LSHCYPKEFAGPLAQNVKTLRHASGLTQQRLAEKADIPRATLGLLESGEANPTLSVVLAVCDALGVQLQELLSPAPSDVLVYRAGELPQKKRGKSTVKKLLPKSARGVELEQLLIPGGNVLVGVPHTVGTREYLWVQAGRLHLHLEGEELQLAEGDVAVFRGHQRHSYRNPGRGEARAVSVIASALSLAQLETVD